MALCNIINNLLHREISLNSVYSSPRSSSNQIIRSFLGLSDSLYKTDLHFHKGCVNSVKFSQDGQYMVSGGDDLTVLFSNVEQSLTKNYRPKKMKMKHTDIIFTLALNHDSTRVFSGGTDEQLIIHDTATGELVTNRFLDSSICDISMNPANSNILAIGCENGQTMLFDCRTNLPEATSSNLLPENSFKSIQYHPLQSHLLLVASSCQKDVSLVDLRCREIVSNYLSPFSDLRGAMCARYNSTGDQILVLRNSLSVGLYNSNNPHELAEFDEFGFFNSITQKCVTFAGPDDSFIVTPSDDFNVFVFKIPPDLKFVPSNDSEHQIKFVNSADFVLRGHQSIVNNVAYNYQRSILATSGVETVIKLWSPFPLNLDKEVSGEHLSTASNDRQIIPQSFAMSNPLISDLDDEESNLSNEGSEVLSYFDYLIRKKLFEDDDEEFIAGSPDERTKKSPKLVDPQFDRDLRYIRSLIADFKLNGETFKKSAIKRLKLEQIKQKSSDEEKKLNKVSSRSISYMLNNKKIKQIKIILRRAYKLIQEKLRFIRKCKKEEHPNDDDWLQKVQNLIDSEPNLKEMLIDLNKLYKAKCRIDSVSSTHYYDILKRLTRLSFRRNFLPFQFIPASILGEETSHSTGSQESAEENAQENAQGNAEENADRPNDSLNNANETIPRIQTNSNDRSTANQANTSKKRASSPENSDSNTWLTLSDDSLSVDQQTDDEEKEVDREAGKNLKRKTPNESSSSRCKYRKNNATESEQPQKKSAYLINLHLFSSNSDSDSDDDDKPILQFKRSNKSDKRKNYNAFAFDSDLDLESDTVLSSDSSGPMKAGCSKSVHKRSADKQSSESSDQKSSDDERRSKRKKNKRAAEERKSDESSDESKDSDKTSTSSDSDDLNEKLNSSISSSLNSSDNQSSDLNESNQNCPNLATSNQSEPNGVSQDRSTISED